QHALRRLRGRAAGHHPVRGAAREPAVAGVRGQALQRRSARTPLAVTWARRLSPVRHQVHGITAGRAGKVQVKTTKDSAGPARERSTWDARAEEGCDPS